MNTFTWIFLAALAATTGFRIWLAMRQLKHVAGHRGAVPAAFADRITLADHRKAADYTVARMRLGLVELAVDVLVTLAFTVAGGLDTLERTIRSLAPEGIAHGLALIAAVTLISGAIGLPFSIWRTFVIEARFGFNRSTWPLFVADLAKSVALGALIGLPVVALVLWILGSLWWLWAWVFYMAFSATMMVVYPTFIAPLFNKFSPLADENLKARIEALLARCGFRAQGLFVMDGSKRSAHGNAYFSGLGKAKRIVFFDTLIERLEPAEIEAVLAHELGHFKRRHIVKRIAFSFALSLAFLALLGWLAGKPWFYAGLGVSHPSTGAALILFFIALPAFTFVLTPLSSLYSRKHEFEADEYAARQTVAGDLVSALVKLYQDNAATLTPDPLYSAVYDSHPPAAIRVAHLQGLAVAA